MDQPRTGTLTPSMEMDMAIFRHYAQVARASADDQPSRIGVCGRLVHKRKLSAALIFGDIALDDGVQLEIMLRACDGKLSRADVKQLNWDLHLGDSVICFGLVERKASGGLLLNVEQAQVQELWSATHAESFDPTRFVTERDDANADATAVSMTEEASSPIASADATTRTYTNIVQLEGQNACKYYFSGARGGKCLKGDDCIFWHGDPRDFDANRKRWLEKRRDQRLAAAQIDGDEHDPHSKRLKAQRARLFCEWLVQTIGEERLRLGTGVIDVAGGKGEIPVQLWCLRGIPTTLIDPRPMKLSKQNRKLVATMPPERRECSQLRCLITDELVEEKRDLFAECALLVGMHPDEATETIVDVAIAFNKPFAIVPCCVMSRLFPDRQCRDGTPVATYDAFVQYLMEKDSRIQRAFLPFTGRNQVLFLFDN